MMTIRFFTNFATKFTDNALEILGNRIIKRKVGEALARTNH